MSCIGLTMMGFTAKVLLDSHRDCHAVALVPSHCCLHVVGVITFVPCPVPWLWT